MLCMRICYNLAPQLSVMDTLMTQSELSDTEEAPPYVFVSYSHEDSATVTEEIAWLRREGFDVHYDQDKQRVEPRDWANDVAPDIGDSAVLLFYVSPASIESRNCNDEVDYARTHQLPILLSFLSETQLPPGWQLRVVRELKISARQALYRNREARADYEQRLCTRLTGYLERDPSHLNPADLGSEPTLAVLPFANATESAALGHVAESIALEVHALLEFQPGIRLIARTSSFAQRDDTQPPVEIGSELGADDVLTGSVTVINNEIQISISMIRVVGDEVLLERSFPPREYATANLRVDIVEAVVEIYKQKIQEGSPSLRVRTTNEEAYRAYIVGQGYWYRQDLGNLMSAIEYYRQAVEHDSDYFDAYIAMANAYLASHSMGTDKAWSIEQANSAIEEARRLMHRTDERSRQELALRSAYCYRINHWSGGLGYEEFIIRAMIESNPSDYAAYGEYGEGILMHSGFYHEAIEYLKVAEAHDPHNVTIKQSLALLYVSLGNNAEASDKLNHSIALDSDNVLSLAYRANLAARMGNRTLAEDDLLRIKNTAGESQLLGLLGANCLAWLGDVAEAEKIIKAETRKKVPADAEFPFLTGLACIALKKYKRGFAYWKHANKVQDRLLHHIRSHVTFFCTTKVAEHVANDKRYTKLLKRIAMDATWCADAQTRAHSLTTITGIPINPPSFP